MFRPHRRHKRLDIEAAMHHVSTGRPGYTDPERDGRVHTDARQYDAPALHDAEKVNKALR